MNSTDRWAEYKGSSFDKIILLIRNGTIKSGRYSRLVKIDKKQEMKGNRFFKDGTEQQNSGKQG